MTTDLDKLAETIVQDILSGIEGSYFQYFLEKLRTVRRDALEQAAQHVHDLGQEIYPKEVFKDQVGSHARHLLENVLPEEIRSLIAAEGEGKKP